VIHHVAIEVAPVDLGRSVGFWELLGFTQVEPPPSLAQFTWLERGGTQIHLLPTESPTVPPNAHVAVVTPTQESTADGEDGALDFDTAVARLEAAGFEVERRREHWGAPRAKAVAPGGHQVELMRSPPRRSVD
jgi:catechol 2,3-dioxygenase-like lactoylglutathione lyase family enzyme